MFSLTAVAKYQGAGIGFVVGSSVQIHDNIGAIFVPAHIKAHRIRLSRIADWVQIGHAGCRQHTFSKGAKRILTSRIGGKKSVSLT